MLGQIEVCQDSQSQKPHLVHELYCQRLPKPRALKEVLAGELQLMIVEQQLLDGVSCHQSFPSELNLLTTRLLLEIALASFDHRKSAAHAELIVKHEKRMVEIDENDENDENR